MWGGKKQFGRKNICTDTQVSEEILNSKNENGKMWPREEKRFHKIVQKMESVWTVKTES